MREFFGLKALEIMVAVHQNLTAPPEEGGTPVKTGHASSNWLLSEGAPDRRVVGSPDAVDTQSQTIALLQTVEGYQGGDLFESNSVGYIDDLNNGSSAQAPSGFVQAAIVRAIDTASGTNTGFDV